MSNKRKVSSRMLCYIVKNACLLKVSRTPHQRPWGIVDAKLGDEFELGAYWLPRTSYYLDYIGGRMIGSEMVSMRKTKGKNFWSRTAERTVARELACLMTHRFEHWLGMTGQEGVSEEELNEAIEHNRKQKSFGLESLARSKHA